MYGGGCARPAIIVTMPQMSTTMGTSIEMVIMSTITMTAFAQICLMQIQQSLGGKLSSSENNQCVRAKEPSSLSYLYINMEKELLLRRKTYIALVTFFCCEGMADPLSNA